MNLIQFENCDIVVYKENNPIRMETWFRDGTNAPAIPTPAGYDMYNWMGYGYTQELINRAFLHHEFLHTWLMMKFGLPYSPTLWWVAHGQDEENMQEIMYEENAIWNFQRWMNGLEIQRDYIPYLKEPHFNVEWLDEARELLIEIEEKLNNDTTPIKIEI